MEVGTVSWCHLCVESRLAKTTGIFSSSGEVWILSRLAKTMGIFSPLLKRANWAGPYMIKCQKWIEQLAGCI